MNRVIAATALVGLALTLGACGGDSDDDQGTGAKPRTIEIDMRDIAFSPDEVDVRAGETVRFVFPNRGKVDHNAFIGDEEAQSAHEMEMREGDDMGDMDHGAMGEDEAITVEPGERGELTHTFRDDGDVLIGCHQPGHYDAGMKVTVHVS